MTSRTPRKLNPNNRRLFWLIRLSMEPRHQALYPTLRNGQILAVLPYRLSRAEIKRSLVTLYQALIIRNESDRFDFVLNKSPSFRSGTELDGFGR